MTRNQIDKQIRQDENAPRKPVRMRGTNLHKYDFSGLDLTDADFSFSNLRKANFTNSTLCRANFSFANLSHASLENADLTDANLNFCGLTGANLTGANLTGVSMSFTNGGRNVNLPKPPAEKLTLTTLLQKPGWGVLIGSVLGALLIYGSNAIVYFTNLIWTTNDPLMAGFYQFLIVQNVTDGAVVFLLAWSLSGWLSRRFSVVWRRHLLLSVVIMVSFFVVNTVIYLALGQSYIEAMRKRPEGLETNAPWYIYVVGDLLIANVFLYALTQGRQLTRKMSEQEFQLLNMEKLKTRAELDALQAKINPHFLYNALNSIASLVHTDAGKAEEMTMLLSKLFRYSTGREGALFASLADELEMVRTYLQVEQVRFDNRLTFSVEVADPALTELQLPQFLLQPVVENAIKHGIAKRVDEGRIDVRIYEKNDELHLCVHDNGPAFPDDMSGGYGLRSIQEKLNLLYGDDARVELQNWPVKQVLLMIKMARLK